MTGGTEIASAQIPLDRFGIERFAPAPGPNNYLQVEGARFSGHLVGDVGLTLDYAHQPFVLHEASCSDASQSDCVVERTDTELVKYLAQANLHGALVLVDRLQIGLNLPLLLSSGDSFNRTVRGVPVSISGGTQFAVGDPTLSLKARLFGEDQGIFLGASAFATFPIANIMNDDAFLGDESLRVGGHFIAQFVQHGFHIAANVGGFWRPERTFFSTRAASQLTYRAAVGYEITPLVLLFAEVDGASGLSAEVDEHNLEARLAGRLTQGNFQISLAGGAGVVYGVGSPVFRIIAGLSYSTSNADRDGDGVDDDDDACPTEAEDRDGWEDSDGCPELDDDGDGLVEGDQCPHRAEDLDGYEDQDGCPDPDNDGDGIRDGFDGCPLEPEDMDEDRDEDGCPDADTDRDGIDDVQDQCPEEPEDADGFGDEDGCPETDFDEDGIPDDGDECPDQPEMQNGISDEDGCPEEDSDGDGIPNEIDRCPERAETLNAQRDGDGCPDGTALAEIREGQIILLQPIGFASGRARLRGNSQRVVRVIAHILRSNPHFRRIRITAFAGSESNAERNQSLADRRVEAIKTALVRANIEAERIESRGSLAEGENTEDRVEIEIVPVVE